MAPSAFAGQTGASGAHVTPLKLKVNVDHSSFGAGRRANMRQDVHGEFRGGADHTCGNGSAGATPAASTPNRGAPSSAFQMTAVKVAGHTDNFHGTCPASDMAFRWEIAADCSAAAVVGFMQESRAIREETVTIAGPGTKVAPAGRSTWAPPGGHYRSWIGLEVLSPNKMTAGHEAYSIQCAPRAM
jgi:hypothetical protein